MDTEINGDVSDLDLLDDDDLDADSSYNPVQDNVENEDRPDDAEQDGEENIEESSDEDVAEYIGKNLMIFSHTSPCSRS